SWLSALPAPLPPATTVPLALQLITVSEITGVPLYRHVLMSHEGLAVIVITLAVQGLPVTTTDEATGLAMVADSADMLEAQPCPVTRNAVYVPVVRPAMVNAPLASELMVTGLAAVPFLV